MELVHEAWNSWGVPSQTVKAIVNELELETLGCRIDGNAGVIAPPRSVICRLIGLTAWFARNPTQRRHTAEVLGGRWVRCFQFRQEVSSCLPTIGIGFTHRGTSHAKGLSESREGCSKIFCWLLCHLPLMLFDFRLRTSPLVLATGLGVCRTSSLEPKGLLALKALQEGHNFRGEEIGLIEGGTASGGAGVRKAQNKARSVRNRGREERTQENHPLNVARRHSQ